jgi:pyruvate formate lyase activating enzyme
MIREGRTGLCGVRRNTGGILYSEIYGRVSSIALDPIEKKPLYHFYPSSGILSIGTRGCNLKCPYCQNWGISQDVRGETSYYSSGDIIASAKKSNSTGIAYTYSEPLIWIEYVLETGALARSHGLKNVLVTNGFINEEPLRDLLAVTDAMNIDLKTFRKETYSGVQKGGLDEVLRTIEMSHSAGCHVELTTLVVTGINDSMDEMKDIIAWIASVDRSIPWHISRYYPAYRHEAPATDPGFILSVYEEAVESLDHVYCGNISLAGKGSDTICPECRNVVISRNGYAVRIEALEKKDGKALCGRCGHELNMVTG